MRIRTIKPEFFKSDRMADLEPLARILFTGLWCLADRRGRLEDRPRRIKAEVLPYDGCDPDALLDALQRAGSIVRYTTPEGRWIQVVNFETHQRITGKEAETESQIPPPSESDTGETTGKQRGNNGETTETTGKERKGIGIGRDGKGGGAGGDPPGTPAPNPDPDPKPKPKPAPEPKTGLLYHVTLIPDPDGYRFQGVTADDRDEWCRNYGMTPQQLDARLRALLDHCAAAPAWCQIRTRGGAWVATIRNWLGSAHKAPAGNGKRTDPDDPTRDRYGREYGSVALAREWGLLAPGGTNRKEIDNG